MDIIKIENMSFEYVKTRKTLDNINLKIKKGSFTSILGENGSGKSTLLKCILGLQGGFTGSIEVSQTAGYLSQSINVESNFPATVYEIVLSGTKDKGLKSIMYSKAQKCKVNELLKELNLNTLKHKCFSNLSGGQKQRVLLARAFCVSKNFIILDEPTNGLDPNITKQFYELLKSYNEMYNTTILMVSHDVTNIANYCDTVIKLSKGSICFNGSSEEYKMKGAN